MLGIRPVSRNAEAQENRHMSKTPGKHLKNHNENAVRVPPATGGNKGRLVVLETPFQAKTGLAETFTKEPKTATRLQQGGPLADRTPFPNRQIQTENRTQPFQTPLLDIALDFGGTPDSLLRPSSLRKHIRVPRGSLGFNKSFVTPQNQGNPWDVGEWSPLLTQPPPVVPETPVPKEDDDEVEYMPPNTLDLPYDPPFDFDLPDYKVVGETLMDLARTQPYYDGLEPDEIEISPEFLSEAEIPWQVQTGVEDIDTDDPFVAALAALSKTKPPAANSNEKSTQPQKANLARIKADANASHNRSRSTPTVLPAHSQRPQKATTKAHTSSDQKTVASTTNAPKVVAKSNPAARAREQAAAAAAARVPPKRPISVAGSKVSVSRTTATTVHTSSGRKTPGVIPPRPATAASNVRPPREPRAPVAIVSQGATAIEPEFGRLLVDPTSIGPLLSEDEDFFFDV